LLLAAVGGEWLEPFDPAHDQPAGHVFGLAAAGERDEPDFGDLSVGDPPLLGLVEDSLGYLIGCQSCSAIPAIAAVTALVIRAVTENHTFARSAAPTNAHP
jgi:hypothetical protein